MTLEGRPALRAWSAWRPQCPLELQRRIDRATARAIKFLEQMQRPDGAWIPLWFGNQHHSEEENPVYGTSRVLLALASALAIGLWLSSRSPSCVRCHSV